MFWLFPDNMLVNFLSSFSVVITNRTLCFSFQGSAAGKKYKFVVTGHGKYEKVPVDDENEEFTNGNSGKTRGLFMKLVWNRFNENLTKL